MENRRVVVTGMGVVAPNGIGIENFWESLVQGRSGIRKITCFDASSYPSQIAAEVHDFDPTNYMDPKTAKRLGRFAQFALAASEEAVEDAQLDFEQEDPYRTGVIIGTGMGGGDIIETQTAIFFEKGIKRLDPFAAIAICPHIASGAISLRFNLRGPNTTVSSGCDSGLDATYLAYNAIRLGDADLMLAGAGEAPIIPITYGVFCAGGFLSKANENPSEALKPYDTRADGTVLGEGGAVVVMEELEHAIRRDAKIYGEVLAYASINEAHSLYAFNLDGIAPVHGMRKALGDARLAPNDIGYINAHGNGLLLYDVNETMAIKSVFGTSAYSIPVTSIKPITGQSFSATGILQLMTCFLVINHGIIPPTINHLSPDPRCDLNYVANHFIRMDVQNAMMNAHGFGGSHTILIVGSWA